MIQSQLFTPYPLGPLVLSNRIVMAPMTRSRAGEGDAPGELAVTYYTQRAEAGLIITEGAQVSQQGQGYLHTPGSYTEPQMRGWRDVVAAVHAEGSKIFLQLWHVGRVSHVTLQPNGNEPISATDDAAPDTFSYVNDVNGHPAFVPTSRPRQATTEELRQVVADFRDAADNAKLAGFDGVEIHGANGYLLDQFLNSALNRRTDEYGSATSETVSRLPLEIFDAVSDVFTPERVGFRVSPYGTFGGMPADPRVMETMSYLASQLDRRGAAYLHVVRNEQMDEAADGADLLRLLRKVFEGTILLTGRLDLDTAQRLVQTGLADLVGFATAWISNPDLVERLLNGWQLAPGDPTTFYGGDARGYTDYPRYLPIA